MRKTWKPQVHANVSSHDHKNGTLQNGHVQTDVCSSLPNAVFYSTSYGVSVCACAMWRVIVHIYHNILHTHTVEYIASEHIFLFSLLIGTFVIFDGFDDFASYFLTSDILKYQ